MLPLQPLEQRQPLLDLLEPARRRVDPLAEVTQREREIFELRLDRLALLEIAARSGGSIAASSPTRFQTRASPVSTESSASYSSA